MVVKLVRDWDEFSAALGSADPLGLVVAVLAAVGAISVIALNWMALLRVRGVVVRIRRAMAWFFVGQLGKYVPGGIWPIVGQAELARRGGAARGAAYAATATSMLATFLGAVLLASGSGLVVSERRVVAALLVAGLVVVFALLASAVIRRRVHALALRVTKRELRLPDASEVLRRSLLHLPVWILFSVMNVAVVVALSGSPGAGDVVDLAFVTCLSWMAGFVIVGLPGGIGVREAVFVSMTTGMLGPGLAVSVAVVSRVVSIGADLMAAGVSLPFGRQSLPSGHDVAARQVDHPDPVLQRGGDAPADGRRPPT